MKNGEFFLLMEDLQNLIKNGFKTFVLKMRNLMDEQIRGKIIFGAMNDGIDYYKKDEWILFGDQTIGVLTIMFLNY